MICGNCKTDHKTVAEVRACYAGGKGTATLAIPARPNRYAGVCSECSGPVPAETGILAGKPGAWTVSHKPGECPEAQAAETFPEDSPLSAHREYAKGINASLRTRAATYPEVPQGYYATRSATGKNDLDFWRVDRPEKGSWIGRTFVHRVIGGHSDTSVRGATALDAVRAIVALGIEESGNLYADKIGRCKKCNRHLTDEVSRSRRMGPDCYDQQHQ